MNVQKYRLIARVYFVLTSKKVALWGEINCRSFGINRFHLPVSFLTLTAGDGKKTSFDATFPPARPPAPYDHRLPPICRVGCSADFPDFN